MLEESNDPHHMQAVLETLLSPDAHFRVATQAEANVLNQTQIPVSMAVALNMWTRTQTIKEKKVSIKNITPVANTVRVEVRVCGTTKSDLRTIQRIKGYQLEGADVKEGSRFVDQEIVCSLMFNESNLITQILRYIPQVDLIVQMNRTPVSPTMYSSVRSWDPAELAKQRIGSADILIQALSPHDGDGGGDDEQIFRLLDEALHHDVTFISADLPLIQHQEDAGRTCSGRVAVREACANVRKSIMAGWTTKPSMSSAKQWCGDHLLINTKSVGEYDVSLSLHSHILGLAASESGIDTMQLPPSALGSQEDIQISPVSEEQTLHAEYFFIFVENSHYIKECCVFFYMQDFLDTCGLLPNVSLRTEDRIQWANRYQRELESRHGPLVANSKGAKCARRSVSFHGSSPIFEASPPLSAANVVKAS